MPVLSNFLENLRKYANKGDILPIEILPEVTFAAKKSGNQFTDSR
jgi:hypothetical protein